MKSLNTGELSRRAYKKGQYHYYKVGEPFRGNPPYGFKIVHKKLTPCEPEQETIKLIKELLEKHLGYSRITSYLNSNHLYTRNEDPWHRETIKKLVDRIRGGSYQ